MSATSRDDSQPNKSWAIEAIRPCLSLSCSMHAHHYVRHSRKEASNEEKNKKEDEEEEGKEKENCLPKNPQRMTFAHIKDLAASVAQEHGGWS